MSTNLQADATGHLHVPPSLLPDPEPLATYQVVEQKGHLVITKVSSAQHGIDSFRETADVEDQIKAFQAWVTEAGTSAGLADEALSRENLYD